MIDGVQVLHNGTTYGQVTLVGNISVDLVTIKSSLALARATTLGTTLDVSASGGSVMPSVVFQTSVSSATNGENYTDAQVAAYGLTSTNNALVTTWDNFTITIDGLSATASISGVASASGATAKNLIASALGNAWSEKYNTTHVPSGAAGSSPTVSLWNATGNATSGTIAITLKSTASGSRGFNKNVSVAHSVVSTADQVSNTSAGTVTKTGFMDWIIGATAATTDNNSTATAIIMTLLSVTNSVTSTGNQASETSIDNIGVDNLASNLLSYYGTSGSATTTAENIWPTDARGDVVNAEGANEGTTTATVARVSTDRSQWTFTAG
jgi:hypothetical protein